MFDPKDIDQAAVKAKLKELGIDMTTLNKVASVIEKEVPELRNVLKKQSFKKGFKTSVDKAYEEVEDIFDHNEDTPDGDKN